MQIAFMTLLMSNFLQAAPVPPNAETCFDNTLPYFKIVRNLKATPVQKLSVLRPGCEELSFKTAMSDAKTVTEKGIELITKASVAIGGHALSSFSALKGNETQKEYGTKLEAIGQIQDPIERIRNVYELASQYQGKYDSKGQGLTNVVSGLGFAWQTAQNTLNNSASRGSGGVCREFATLLHWSLQQVARAPGSKSQALGPHDFSSEYATGSVPLHDTWNKSIGHAWVRINLPEHDASGQLREFRHFDLDTTDYPGKFAPLFPRRSGVTTENSNKLYRQCELIQSCLGRISNADPTTSPPPGARQRSAQ